ncbi:MAG: metallophosphoesterase [Fusobacteria bacterium]|nr:metallophosphoesterase [Fusobacteriota bacterium]
MKKSKISFILTFVFSMIALLQFSYAMSGSSVITNVPNPFNNGSSGRNEIVVISDLHMGADPSYSELKTNLPALQQLLVNIRASSNVKELVIGGDLVDEWFVPANIDTYQGKGQSDFIKRVALTNQGVITAFNNIIKDGKIKVIYIPGNHDLTITQENIDLLLPGVIQMRDKQLGLGTYLSSDIPQLAIEHGHRYNFFCAPDMISNQDIAPGTILPPGYFFTRIGTLHLVENSTKNTSPIPNVTLISTSSQSQQQLYAYFQLWKWTMSIFPINESFGDKIIVTNVNGFKGNYSVNDLLPYQTTPTSEIQVNLFNNSQNTWEQRQKNNLVAVLIPTEHAIANAASADELDNTAFTQYLANPNSNKRIVVFGHNHRATLISSTNSKGQKTIYANSGTWIDNNPGASTENFVIITIPDKTPSSATKVAVYNFNNEVYTQMAADTVSL